MSNKMSSHRAWLFDAGSHQLRKQDKEQLRMDVSMSRIDSMGRTFLGMTLGCCRCHDHKFDPIQPQITTHWREFFAARNH